MNRLPRLVLALGNPLMGDDGVAWHLVERLRADPRLPPDVEAAWGGTDLLACADLLADRERIVLVDAVEAQGGEPPGHLVELDPDDPELDRGSPGAHTLSLPAALALLRRFDPGLAGAHLRLLGVAVPAVGSGERLSPALEARLPEIAEWVLAALGSPHGPPAPRARRGGRATRAKGKGFVTQTTRIPG